MVASFSIIADLVRQVGGERVAVTSLVAANADMHSFQPAPSHARLLTSAKLVVINGLSLEGWADRFVKASGYKGARLVASRGIKALPAAGTAATIRTLGRRWPTSRSMSPTSAMR